jgi:glycosyltransferase involved in cell wall biosynthesis
MRVALLSPPFESVPPRLYGGTERVVHALCRGLAQSGVEVTLFAPGDSQPLGGVEFEPTVPQALRLCNVPMADAAPYHLKMLAQVAARARDFDVIHNHHDYWMLPLGAMTPVPVVTTLHGQLDLPHVAEALRAFPTAGFVSISESQRAPLPDLRWLRTIHHGLDLAGFRFAPKPGKYLAFVGRITPQKRPDWAIQVAKLSGVPLKIAAKIEGPEMQQYYEERVRPHVDGRFIEYVGEIGEAEKAAFLGDALATVFPVDWPEPFGLVMIESLACGTPVLARPCGAAPEILADGITGFSSMDIAELARRVHDIPSLDRDACRRWVEDRFSLERMIGEYLHVYQHLVDFKPIRAGRGTLAPAHRHRRDFLHPVERAADRDPKGQLQG